MSSPDPTAAPPPAPLPTPSRTHSLFRRSSALSAEEADDIASGIRIIRLNDPVANAARNFTHNVLRTAKYTPLNIIPKALFEQFRRFSNFYFLVIAVVSFIDGISPSTPAANVIPLFVVVGFSFARDVYEDIKRSLEDRRQSAERHVILARPSSADPTVAKGTADVPQKEADALERDGLPASLHRGVASRNIKVGDIVFMRKGQVFPCDLLLLHSSVDGGVAYVSTANLDGESNLKRVVVAAPTGDITQPEELVALSGFVRAQKPTTALHELEATIKLDGHEAAPLDASNLLLRGSILRNTEYIYGLCMYTGAETKVALNMRNPPSKMGNIERKLNLVVLFLFAVLAVLVISASIGAAVLDNREADGQWYMAPESSTITSSTLFFRSLGTFLILFSTFIPVSLFVTLEFIRVLQALFISADYRMKTKDVSVVARATNLNEMLGEVEHILSDKTGTLTENIMRYIACSADGRIFNILKKKRAMENAVKADVRPVKQLLLSMALCHSVVPEPKAESAGSPGDEAGAEPGQQPQAPHRRRRRRDGAQDVSGTTGDDDGVEVVFEGAHPIMDADPAMDVDPVDPDVDIAADEALPEYQGPSPDEVALVSSAREYGIALLRKTLDTMVIDHFGTVESYTLMAELEFNSDRKRMSVVLRCPDGQVRMYTKGADTIMLQLLTADTDVDTIQNHIDEFAKEGLRTLVFAYKEFSEEEFSEWFERFQEARNSLEGRDEAVADVSAEVEKHLIYIATTAVEDKLQDMVPETIKFMREAGVKLWVLTGDKRETAENIGYSSNLLDKDMDVVNIKGSTSDEIQRQLSETLERHIADDHMSGASSSMPRNSSGARNSSIPRNSSVPRNSSLASLARRVTARERKKVEEKELGIIIDGASLHFAIEDHGKLFMELSDHTKVVICCRVTPLQKALVVRLVREELQATTLAIGDGGNDVSMIQEAHIGVGIFGKEGTQAARSADYAMGEFKHLLRLTALHGRYAGVRSAGMINLSFYKNIVFTLTQVFFQAFDFVSGTTFNNQWVTSAFNVLVTSASPFLYGIFERDLDESTIVRFPSVYAVNRDRKLFSLSTAIEYTMLYGVWHAVAVFFGTYLLFGYLRVGFRNGQDSGLVLVGLVNSTLTVILTLFKIVLHSHLLNWIVLLAIVLSVAVYLAVMPAATYIVDELELEGQLSMMFSSPLFYVTVFVVVTASFLVDFVVLIGRQLFAPNVMDRLQMWERASDKARKAEKRKDGKNE